VGKILNILLAFSGLIFLFAVAILEMIAANKYVSHDYVGLAFIMIAITWGVSVVGWTIFVKAKGWLN